MIALKNYLERLVNNRNANSDWKEKQMVQIFKRDTPKTLVSRSWLDWPFIPLDNSRKGLVQFKKII